MLFEEWVLDMEDQAVFHKYFELLEEKQREFIRKLKQDLKKYLNYDAGTNDVDYIIDKLAGDLLL